MVSSTLVAFLALLYLHPLPAVGQAAAAAAYAPSLAPCPPGVSLVRHAGTGASQSLSPSEQAYISSRQSLVLPSSWKAYLVNVETVLSARNATPLPSYVSDILSGANTSSKYPAFGIATSGGGYRAAIVGGGVLNALDGRNLSSTTAGTGGLLQCASYLAGLSGGSWLVTSLAQADFPTIPDLIFGSPGSDDSSGFGGWLADYSLVDPSTNPIESAIYFSSVLTEVAGKILTGLPVSFTDVWARILSRHFVNGTDSNGFFDPLLTHGAGITFSSIANVSTFQSYYQPFPIVTADSLSPNENTSTYYDGEDIFVPLTNPIYEFNVYEMGSFDPPLSAFTPMKYLGSPNGSICATGFDQASFITAISSNIFNTFNLTSIFSNSPLGAIADTLLSLFDTLTHNGTVLDPVNAQVPNPFYGVADGTYVDSNETVLTLVDGGENGLSIPFTPLLAKARGVDVILGIDLDGDTAENWADGSALVATQDYVSYYPSTYSFPPVPTSPSSFLAQNLTTRPTFFGCNSSSPVPLLIYIANGGPPLGQSPLTNTTADQVVYADDEIDGMLSQTFDIATQGIPVDVDGAVEKDPEWPACLACALVDRSRSQAGLARSGVCVGCMARYCWS